MRVILSDRAKFYAVSDGEGGWTFKNDGANYYLYPLNSFDYGSKIVEYIKIELEARVYKASGYRVQDAYAFVSMHKDDADLGEHIFEKYTALDRTLQIFVDYFMPAEEGYEVEEGDYIEVDMVGFDDAVGLAILMNQSSPEPTPEPTVYDFQIITRGSSTSIFATTPQAGEDYSEDYYLYAVGIRNSELYKFVDDGEGNWDADSLFAEEYNEETARVIKNDIPMAEDDAYAWVAVEPKASNSTPVEDEEEPEEEA